MCERFCFVYMLKGSCPIIVSVLSFGAVAPSHTLGGKETAVHAALIISVAQ